uniref:Uncharacterized protein n=1 Tax=Paramormyrops kingsleyae TaxID=1676925 RepID=A0A3B3SK74_9TELE
MTQASSAPSRGCGQHWAQPKLESHGIAQDRRGRGRGPPLQQAPCARPSRDQPAVRRPACSGERPDCSEERPACSEERPACSEERPACSEERPACSEERPACSEERPACSEERPAYEEASSYTNRSPFIMGLCQSNGRSYETETTPKSCASRPGLPAALPPRHATSAGRLGVCHH